MPCKCYIHPLNPKWIVHMRKDFKPPKHVDSQQSTTDAFMQDTVISGITLWTHFSLDIAKFNIFSNLFITLAIAS